MAATEADPSARRSARRSGGIRFDDVTVAYNGTVVLDSFTLDVAPGEVVALLGPSGSGKTTALRAVAGFVRPVAGRVLASAAATSPTCRRTSAASAWSSSSTRCSRTCASSENVAFGLQAQKVAEVARSPAASPRRLA